MELLYARGCAPRFPFELFRERQHIYADSDAQQEWESLEDLQSAANLLCQTGAMILGHISRDTAEKWLAWKHGELYAMGYRGGVLFCLPGGTVVV